MEYRAEIPPLPEGFQRPMWSVMIPTYNCAKYLRKTLESVLAQDPGREHMQIEVVDDCSTEDDPQSVVDDLGLGRVSFYRQSQNVGLVRNFETCLLRSKGRLIHQLHGDDYVREGFYSEMEKVFGLHPEVGATFCRSIYTNQEDQWLSFSDLLLEDRGVVKNFAELQAVKQRIQTPSMVVRREVYENLGGFDRRLVWTEDWEMWTRIAMNYPIGFSPEPLAVYRRHRASSTTHKVVSGENVRDVARCIGITTSYFQPKTARRLRVNAARHWAVFCVKEYARPLLAAGMQRAAWKQFGECFKLSPDTKLVREFISFLLMNFRIIFFGKSKKFL